MQPLHPLVVAARRYVHARRSPTPPAPDPAAFRRRADEWIGRCPAGVLAGHALVDLPGDRPPWHDTGIDLAAGEDVSWVADGRITLSERLDVWVGPQFQLWARVGEEGPVFNGMRATHSFRAETPGRLYLASYFPGQWADPSGRLGTSIGDYRGTAGGLSVLLLRWSCGARDALRAWADAGGLPRELESEAERLDHPVDPPPGWEYLWFLGRSEIFRPTERGIGCHTCANVGILRTRAPAPLREDSVLRWSWKVDALPSRLPEDVAFVHDYMSIAVEFSNGRDLTYYWSAELPPETGYWCPLPTWKDREFHVVVRSGDASLGDWLSEERNLYEDYRRYIGPPPERIVRVWLIANSVFQRRDGRSEFADIRIESGDGALQVL